MPSIDPNIVFHKIKMYLDAKPIQKCLHLFHPKKVVNIKSEVEKFLCVGFIYLVPLTDWVSNVIHVRNKHETIHVCVNYEDVNHACPKENYPTLFIN